MRTREFLSDVCKRIKYKPASKPIAEELEGHIEDLKSEYICKGYNEEVAEEKAVEQMGDAKQIEKRLNKIHRPKMDWITLILAIVFILFGRQFGAIFHPEHWWDPREPAYFTNHYKLSYIGLILGILLSIFIYFYDYRKICKHSRMLYILATALNIIAYRSRRNSFGK